MCLLQVVGGRYIQGRYGAVIEKVKQGSVADLAGRLLPGDEVNAAAALYWRVAVSAALQAMGGTNQCAGAGVERAAAAVPQLRGGAGYHSGLARGAGRGAGGESRGRPAAAPADRCAAGGAGPAGERSAPLPAPRLPPPGEDLVRPLPPGADRYCAERCGPPAPHGRPVQEPLRQAIPSP